MYNAVVRALELLGLSNAFGDSQIPLYVLNVTYPLIDDEVKEFCSGKRAVLVIEEGQPDFIEQNLHAILRKAGLPATIHGKDMLAMAGEYTASVVTKGILKFVESYGQQLIDQKNLPTVAKSAAKSDILPVLQTQVQPDLLLFVPDVLSVRSLQD